MVTNIVSTGWVQMQPDTWNTFQMWFTTYQYLSVVEFVLICIMAYFLRNAIWVATKNILSRIIGMTTAWKLINNLFDMIFPYGNWVYYITLSCFLLVVSICEYSMASLFGIMSYRKEIGDPIYQFYPVSVDPLIGWLFVFLGDITLLLIQYFGISLAFDLIRKGYYYYNEVKNNG
jgi:hypothetical protein